MCGDNTRGGFWAEEDTPGCCGDEDASNFCGNEDTSGFCGDEGLDAFRGEEAGERDGFCGEEKTAGIVGEEDCATLCGEARIEPAIDVAGTSEKAGFVGVDGTVSFRGGDTTGDTARFGGGDAGFCGDETSGGDDEAGSGGSVFTVVGLSDAGVAALALAFFFASTFEGVRDATE